VLNLRVIKLLHLDLLSGLVLLYDNIFVLVGDGLLEGKHIPHRMFLVTGFN